MNDSDDRVPDLLVELYMLGELSPDQAKKVELRLAAEDGGLERLAELRDSNDAILEAYPVMEIAGRIERAAERKERQGRAEPEADEALRKTSSGPSLFVGFAIAILLAAGGALFLIYASESSNGVTAVAADDSPRRDRVGRAGGAAPPAASETREELDRAARNARAKRLKEGFSSGELLEGEEALGLILALERKANRALNDGNPREAEIVCREARELEQDACPWLEGALESYAAEHPSLAEEFGKLEGDLESGFKLSDGVKRDPDKATELMEEGSKAMLRGEWEMAIEKCSYGLAHGNERCHRVLGVAYKNLGKKKDACFHLKKIGAVEQTDIHCED